MPIPEINLASSSQSQLWIISVDLKCLGRSLVHKRLRSLFRLLIIVFSINSKIFKINSNLRLRRVHLPCEMISLRGKVMIFHPNISILDIEAMCISLLHCFIFVAIALSVINVLTHCNIYYCLLHSTVCSLYSYIRLVLEAKLWLRYLRHFLCLTDHIVLWSCFFADMMSIIDISSFNVPILHQNYRSLTLFYKLMIL